MSEKTRAELMREIAELHRRFQQQDRLLARLKKSAPETTLKSPRKRPVATKKRSESSASESVAGAAPDWFEKHLPAVVSPRGVVVAIDAKQRIATAVATDVNLNTLLSRRAGSPWVDHLTMESREAWRTYYAQLIGGSGENHTEDRLRLHLRFGRTLVAATIVSARRFAPQTPTDASTARVWLILEVDGQANDLRNAAAAYWGGAFAHELNQPLAAALTTAQACRSLLESARPPLQDLKLGAEALVQRVQHAAEIVRRLRSLAGGEPPRRLAADLRLIVRQALEAVQTLIDEHRVSVHLDFPASPLIVSVDAVQIAQVVANLARNAVEAMNSVPVSQRQLTVRIHRETSRSVKTDFAEAVVSIADRGTGLSVDVVQRLFAPLASTKPGGMGLGLALSRQIVEAHGGRIWAEGNSPDGDSPNVELPGGGSPRGSIFSFSLSLFSEEP